MDPVQQGGTQLPPLPVKSGDTYSYKGWLISDSFLKRAFAVLGYNMVAGLILYIPIIIIMSFLIGGMVSMVAPGLGQPAMHDNMMMQTPPPMPQMEDTVDPMMMGKIDINAVCNGAVAYMSFPDSTAADAFVQECIDGQHPEVVQQYMQQMKANSGIDEAAI